jgi:hypothetical protein
LLPVAFMVLGLAVGVAFVPTHRLREVDPISLDPLSSISWDGFVKHVVGLDD